MQNYWSGQAFQARQAVPEVGDFQQPKQEIIVSHSVPEHLEQSKQMK